MEFENCLTSRRSIRKYKDEELSSDVIKKLVRSANLAPSWKNSQVSKFYVALSKNQRQKIFDLLPTFNQNNTINASAYIISTVVDKISGCNKDGRFSQPIKDGYQYFDNGLQVQNLCLEATNLGLGTLIMGIFDEQGIRAIFDIPENEKIVAVISVGYPDINPTMPTRKPLDEILKIY